jgi:hypothetical protein
MKMQNYNHSMEYKIKKSDIHPNLKVLIFKLKNLVILNSVKLEIYIAHEIENELNITFEQIKGKKRNSDILYARQLTSWILDTCTCYGHKNIGKILCKNQSNCVNSNKVVFNYLSTKMYGDKRTRLLVYKILNNIYKNIELSIEISKNKIEAVTIEQYNEAMEIINKYKYQQELIKDGKLIQHLEEKSNNTEPILHNSLDT